MSSPFFEISAKSTKPIQNVPETSNLPTPPTDPPTDEDSSPTISAQIRRILQEIRARKNGHSISTEQWQTFFISPAEYDEFRRFLDSDSSLGDWVKDKLRWDYFPGSSKLVLRMLPSINHELFLEQVEKEIQRQLAAITGPSAIFAQSIQCLRSAGITPTTNEFGPHSPDTSFGHVLARFAGIVIEVAYTQKSKDLSELADDYILGTDGNVQAMIGFDITYQGQMAAFSIWRPRYQTDEEDRETLVTEQAVTAQAFRSHDGTLANPQSSLRIPLKDFAPDLITQQQSISDADEIVISSSQLWNFLRNANNKTSITQTGTGIAGILRPGVKRKRRQKTPEDVVEEGDSDGHVSKSVVQSDSSFEGAPSSLPSSRRNSRILRKRSR